MTSQVLLHGGAPRRGDWDTANVRRRWGNGRRHRRKWRRNLNAAYRGAHTMTYQPWHLAVAPVLSRGHGLGRKGPPPPPRKSPEFLFPTRRTLSRTSDTRISGPGGKLRRLRACGLRNRWKFRRPLRETHFHFPTGGCNRDLFTTTFKLSVQQTLIFHLTDSGSHARHTHTPLHRPGLETSVSISAVAHWRPHTST